MTTRYHPSTPGLGDLLAGRRGGRHLPRTGNPVRRNSIDVDDERCGRYPLPFHEEEVPAYLQALERWNLDNKQPGKYVGPLHARGVEVMRWLLREAKNGRGVCRPSHLQIAAGLKIGLRTVRRIMKALFLHGFLEWQRRSVEVEGDGGGVRREQTSNLYRFNIPAALVSMVGGLVARRTGRTAAPPRTMRIVGPAELSDRPEAWQRMLTGGTRLAGALSRLAEALSRSTKDAKLALS